MSWRKLIHTNVHIIWCGRTAQLYLKNEGSWQHSSIVSEQKLKFNQFKLNLFRSKLTFFRSLYLSQKKKKKKKRQTTFKKNLFRNKIFVWVLGESSLMIWHVRFCTFLVEILLTLTLNHMAPPIQEVCALKNCWHTRYNGRTNHLLNILKLKNDVDIAEK